MVLLWFFCASSRADNGACSQTTEPPILTRGTIQAPKRKRSKLAGKHDSDDDAAVANLTRRQVLDIDAAFDAVVERAKDRRPIGGLPLGEGGFMVDDEAFASQGGGFIIDDQPGGGFIPEEDGGGGGFIVDNEASAGGFIEDAPLPDIMPLSRISLALDRLDLPCDDALVDVFRDVAEGDPGADDDGLFVHRRHFVKVCAALMGNEAGSSSGDADVYEPAEASSSELDRRRLNKGKGRAVSDQEATVVKPGRKAKKGATVDREKVQKLFDAFAPTETSMGRVITTRGIRMVADLLHEKLTDDEVRSYLSFQQVNR